MTRPRPGNPMGVRTIEDLPALSGRRVLLRATLDLPMGPDPGSPVAALRLERLTETVRALRARGASVTVFGDTHPPGVDEDPQHAKQIAADIEAVGAEMATPAALGSVEDSQFLDQLVAGHDAFVDDSFQWSYLPLPSLLVPAECLASAAGRGLEHDLDIAADLLHSPQRPVAAVLGGQNSMLRLHGLRGLVLRCDLVLVGGAMSMPMLEAVGKRPAVGTPEWLLSECRAVMGLAERVQHRIQLPLDVVVRRPDGTLEVCDPSAAPSGDVVDIGPLTARRFAEAVHGVDSVVWTGALGVVEDSSSAEGTLAVAGALPRQSGRRIVVGGDSLVAYLRAARRLDRRIDVISATDSLLELFKSGDLPALRPLRA